MPSTGSAHQRTWQNGRSTCSWSGGGWSGGRGLRASQCEVNDFGQLPPEHVTCSVGALVGASVGAFVDVGARVGTLVGVSVGAIEGALVGTLVGEAVTGAPEGALDGVLVGVFVGTAVGTLVGAVDGVAVVGDAVVGVAVVGCDRPSCRLGSHSSHTQSPQPTDLRGGQSRGNRWTRRCGLRAHA